MKVAVFIVALLTAQPAWAAAWTQAEGGGQVFIGATFSGAGTSYDFNGRADKPAAFEKLWSSIWAEYGWSDSLTLILSPEYAWARTRDAAGLKMAASEFAFGGGARYRIFDSDGTLSVQATFKSAGAFDMSVAVNNKSGEQGELRLLYGTNFKLFGLDGCADFEIGERWIAGARPNETPIDLTLGLHVFKTDMILIQSFNIIAGGDAKPPYNYYRSHKLELSYVSDIGHGISIQSGTYFSPAGQNALDEMGAQVSVWVKF